MIKKLLFFLLVATTWVPAQTAKYGHDGKALLPDHKVTPGAVSDREASQLCDASFHTATVRNVPRSVKNQVCVAYGVTKCDKHVEIDHLVSLEIGGTNDPANLWPQPYLPTPGARQKDIVENWLHRQVCAKDITLAEAQREIRTDWYKVYKKMTLAQQKEAAKKR